MDVQAITTTISDKYQTVVPSQVRKILGAKKKTKLTWSVEKKGREKKVVVSAPQKGLGDQIWGLGHEVWKGVDVDKYINDLRDEWEQ